MAKKSQSFQVVIEKANLPTNNIKTIFNAITDRIENKKYADTLGKLFLFALHNDVSLFPAIWVDMDQEPSKIVADYLEAWSQSYIKGKDKLSIKSPLKNYGEKDAALIERVQTVTQVDDDTLNKYIEGHFLFMSAENRNGTILEEYLAYVLEPYGWIWCAGSTYRAIDFCKLEDGVELLQVKNKYNTENSSSSAIRTGTKIKKWERLTRPKVETGLDKPIANWRKLREIVNADNELSKKLQEEQYLEFIRENSSTDLDRLESDDFIDIGFKLF